MSTEKYVFYKRRFKDEPLTSIDAIKQGDIPIKRRASMSHPHEIETLGHEWITDDDGETYIFAFNPADPHNGPRCKICDYSFCYHCQPGPSIDCIALEISKEKEAETCYC